MNEQVGAWELPGRWEWHTLGDVCEINPRKPSLERDEDAPTSFVPMAALDEERGAITDMQVKPYNAVNRGYTYFEEDDVLFAKITPCMENGKSAIARGLIDGIGFGSTEFHRIRPGGRLIPEWVHLFVRQQSFRDEAASRFRGSVGQQRVPKEFLLSHPIPVPPTVETQRRIVARIEELFARIEEARRLRGSAREEAGRMMQSILSSLRAELVSQYPTRPIKEMIDQGLLEMSGGGTPSRQNPAFWQGPIPWASPKDIKTWIIQDSQEHISEDALNASSAKLVPTGSILIVVRGMILARTWPVAVSGCDLAVNQDMKALWPTDETVPEYLGYMLRALESEVLIKIRTAAHGTKRLTTETLEALEVPTAPLAQQHRIVHYLDGMRTLTGELDHAQEGARGETDCLEQSILARAFRGEL